MIEFLLFLTAKEKEILDLVYKANYSIEENTPLCLLGESYFGFFKKSQKRIVICTKNAMRFGGHLIPRATRDNDDYNPTAIYIRRALRHEAVHVAQSCNNEQPLNMKEINKVKLHPYKKNALQGSSNISGSKQKEYEAYAIEDRPKLVIMALKRYCF